MPSHNRIYLLSILLLAAGLLADQPPEPTWAKAFHDCEGKPLEMFLSANSNPRYSWEQIELNEVADADLFNAKLKQVAQQFPDCSITPVSIFLRAAHNKYLDRTSWALEGFTKLASSYPAARLPFAITGDGYWRAGTLMAPAAWMAIAEIEQSENRVQALTEVIKRYPNEPDGWGNTYEINALVSLFMHYIQTEQKQKAREVAGVLLDQRANQEFRAMNLCGKTHFQVLDELAHLEPDFQGKFKLYQNILRNYSNDLVGVCHTDNVGWGGETALYFIEKHCGVPAICIDYHRMVVQDMLVPGKWRAWAQLRLARYFQDDLKDCSKAIAEFKVMAKEFGEIEYYDFNAFEDPAPDIEKNYGNIAAEKIAECEAVLVNTKESP